MRIWIADALCTVTLAGVFGGYGIASPLSSRLLALVPSGAQIVAGFDNRSASGLHGRLLLATHNNRLDLDDFQSVTGVDHTRMFAEVVEVADAAPDGALSEHLLLVGGRLDRERIYRSLQQNGARATEFRGQTVMLLEPFTRERGDMVGTRWLVILDNRLGLFGTSSLVQRALQRYADHSLPDPVLQERLSLMRSDVTSWNVIVESGQNTSNISFAQPNSAWTELQHDTDVLMIAAHFGSKIRVDFSIHADAGHGAEFFARKAAVFTDALNPGSEAAPADAPVRLPASFSVESNHVQGSVELSSAEFQTWCEHLYRVRGSQAAMASNDN